ncbi:MAG: hypothetical protein JHC26_07540 [Thermofilum sp.]|uniref:hypothetical protein n=1 Tax=Thermofilum sp. TaxID=1961369 RepID=UPI00258B09D3|nr:hypothetical protein [Thermofilum sp.]MCI4408930.1 hypothetical protein [Thermofilum sp.]
MTPSQAFKGKNNIDKRYSIIELKYKIRRILGRLESYGIFFVSVNAHSKSTPKIHFIVFNVHGKMVFIKVSNGNSKYRKKRYRLMWTENTLPGKYVVVDKNTVDELASFLVSELGDRSQQQHIF